MTKDMGKVGAVALVLAALLTARGATAQGTAPAALAMFEAGSTALAAQQFDIACEKFRASDALDPSVRARANLGECEERRGRLASAWEAYSSALRMLSESDPRHKLAKAHVAALEPRLPRLVLVLAPGASRETVVREGDAPIGTASTYGIALPFDPGVRHLSVIVPGQPAQAIEVTLAEGETRTVTVGAPLGAPLASSTTAPVLAPVPALPPPSSAASSGAEQASGAERVGPWIVGGVGAASLIVGIATGVVVLSDQSTVNTNCSDVTRTCTATGASASIQGRALGPLTTVALVTGGAGLTAAGLWMGLSGKRPAKLGVAGVAGGAVARVEGSW